MLTNNADISVIICVYTEERWDDITAALGSLQRQTHPPSECIIVVDYNDALLQRITKGFPNVMTITNSGPKGLSGAKNSGIAASSSQLVAFLDDDAVAAPDWLSRLVTACAGSLILGAGGSVEPVWDSGRPRWFPKEFDWVVGCSYRGMPEEISPIRNPLGGCMCIRRDVVDAVGGFHTGMGRIGKTPLGCEETDLCIRARQRWPGSLFLYDPGARIYHRVPKRRSSWGYFRSRCWAEGLSKALVSRNVGIKDGLESERQYTLRILPSAVLHGVTDAVIGRDVYGLARSAAVLAGFAVTTAGFVSGIAQRQLGRQTNARKSGDSQTCKPSHA